MGLISELYRPDIALLCIGGHYTMGPAGAAYALNNVCGRLALLLLTFFYSLVTRFSCPL